MRTTRLRGAKTHNLKNIDLDLKPGSLVGIAGPSGAGKSSLAFATLYAEGQRRYVESFSAYARQFLERLPRPPVEELDPIPASIAVDRQGPVRTSRSTVGTMTEIADYAKALWAQLAVLHCPTQGDPIRQDNPNEAADRVLDTFRGRRVVVLYPLRVETAEAFLGVREQLLSDGYRRIWLGDGAVDLDTVRPSDVVKANRRGRKKTAPATPKLCVIEPSPTVEVVADRLKADDAARGRLVEALEMAMARGEGRAVVVDEGGERLSFSSGLSCARCGVKFRPAIGAAFSFNSPIGACEVCRGFGRVITVDFDKVIPDRRKSLARGAIAAWGGKATQWERKILRREARKAGVPFDKPLSSFTKKQLAWLIEGDDVGWPDGWGGLRAWFDWLESRAYRMHVRVFLSRYRKYETCTACEGKRLKPTSLLWKVNGRSIADFLAMSADTALTFVRELRELPSIDPATELLVSELEGRIRALNDVGLGYLTLDRQSRTLSGGEAQRVSLTGALGSSLTGALFVLDEPTVGLHPADVHRLTQVVQRLTQGGNLVVAVEHDLDVLNTTDVVVELGPHAGERGGEIVFEGPPHELLAANTATGRAARGETSLNARRERREPKGWIKLTDARGNNLKGVDLKIPLGVLTCVTGVSGSGKSSLLLETFVPAAQRALGQSSSEVPLPHQRISGLKRISEIIKVDQAPLGRTSRGNPATYLKIWDLVRKIFAAESLSVERGYGPGFFSTNVPGGRCEVCKGQGFETVEMQFLADITFSCPACQGKRFTEEALEVFHRGRNVAEILDLTVAQAQDFFEGNARVLKALQLPEKVGLSYLRLGQPLNTLSGGEAQRLKLASAMATTKDALFVLDEPSAGLHAQDIAQVMEALFAATELGHTVVVVEHDMRVAAAADHVIDLGPGAGDAGGEILISGTPEEVAESGSTTARFLSAELEGTSAIAKAEAKPDRDEPAESQSPRIVVSGAREHNLRNVDVELPHEQLVVVSGPSGSGKSTLAFDIIHAEGRRRFLDTLSPYARQYMPQLPRPEVDRVYGVPPTVSLEQRMTRGGANSTVATVTEVAHFLRLLYARLGETGSDAEAVTDRQSPDQFASAIRKRFGTRSRLTVFAHVVQGRKGLYREQIAKWIGGGFDQARIDGDMVNLREGMSLSRYKEHEIELKVARVRGSERHDLIGAIRRAASVADGAVVVRGRGGVLRGSIAEGSVLEYGARNSLDPRLFSFNTRQGACPVCDGRGVVVRKVGRGKNAREIETVCPECNGHRLSRAARSVLLEGRPITDFTSRSVEAARREFAKLRLKGRASAIGNPVLKELDRRLAFLEEVGVGYLGLDRSAATLSGGETQRVRLAAQLGSGLTGVLYVLDEPTIGLHPRDTLKLIGALTRLVERGNTVMVVEHDADVIASADYLIDVGPGGGVRGGQIVASGPVQEALSDPRSVTGAAMRRPTSQIAAPSKPRSWLELDGAAEHNLKGIDIRFALGALNVVTGVSGSGKSTLVRRVLLPAVRDQLGLVNEYTPGRYEEIRGADELERAVEVDQSPIGRTPRSVPATYVGIWDEIRRLYAATPEARARGYKASRFSFNTSEGRCPACEGQGVRTVEMSFLPDVLVACELCGGKRFDPETLEPKLHGLSAGDLLELDVEEAADRLSAFPKVHRPLSLLSDLGLGYLKLGQPSNTLSGGEAQRLKLVAELGTGAKGKTLYVLDEPTTGLHRDDVGRLLNLLKRFVDRGDTVVVIEHNLDVVMAADWIVDLGPEGGEGGGRVVASGHPSKVLRSKRSRTAEVMRRALEPTGTQAWASSSTT